MATPTVIGTNTDYAASSAATSFTFSHTVPSTGSNRALLVIAHANSGNNTAFTGATYNGTSMTQIVSVAGVYLGGGIMFYLADPDTGANNVVLSSSTSKTANAVAFTLQDTAQSSPVDVTDTRSGDAGQTSWSDSITTTVNNDLIIAWSLILGTTSSLTFDGSQSEICNFTGDALSYRFSASSLPKETAGAQTMGEAWTGSSALDFFQTSIKYEAASTENIAALNGTTWENVTSVNGINK